MSSRFRTEAPGRVVLHLCRAEACQSVGAADLEAPILALQAGADQNITAEMNEAFEQALTDAGVEHELVTYEGAPHSFFDRRYEEFDEASEDAWRRVLEFLETHSA